MKNPVLLAALVLSARVSAVSINLMTIAEPHCTYMDGYLSVYASGGIPPYSYLWNTGDTVPDLFNLGAGTYTVTVTDGMGQTDTETYVLNPTTYEAWAFPQAGCPNSQFGPPFRMFCQGHRYQVGVDPVSTDPGYMVGLLWDWGPWGFDTLVGITGFDLYNQPAGTQVDVPFVENSGCTGVIHLTIPNDFQVAPPQILQVDGACSGGNNGSIHLFTPQDPDGFEHYLSLDAINQDNWTGSLYGGPPGSANNEYWYENLPAGDHWLVTGPRWGWAGFGMDAFDWLEDWFLLETEDNCKDSILITVPDLGFTCGTVHGKAYVDHNQNCTRNGAGEPLLPGMVLEFQPGGQFALVDPQGNYTINLPYGSYTVEQQSPYVVEHCIGAPTPFDITLQDPEVLLDLADTAITGVDVVAIMGCGPARPGFQWSLSTVIENLTAAATGAVTVTVTFDATVSYISASPPATVVGNTVTWNLPSIAAFQHRTAHLSLQVPPNVNLIGTNLLNSCTVTTANADIDLSNNASTLVQTITGAYDPNDKAVRTSSSWSNDLYYIGTDEWVDYTIRFQNTGSDTAFLVVITDTIGPGLDLGSFILGPSSHSCQVSVQGGNVLRFMFPNILLPDSNTNEPKSHGHITFRMRPTLPLLPGTVLSNNADIFFDFNPPIRTNDALVMATQGTGTAEEFYSGIALRPNPVMDELTITSPASPVRTLAIVATDGRVLLQFAGQSGLITMDVAALDPGLYVVRAELLNGRAANTTFIKQ